MFLGGNTTWQSVSSFGDRGTLKTKNTQLHEEKLEANVEGSGWFACPAPIWPSFDKIALVEL